MKVCGNCKLQVGDTLKYCPSCGSDKLRIASNSSLAHLTTTLTATKQNFASQTNNPSSWTAQSPLFQPNIIKGTHPWRRYFARMFDGVFFSIIISVLVTESFPDIGKLLALPILKSATTMIYTVAFVPVEAFCLYAFGTTLGKFLYGIKIYNKISPISYSIGFKRTINVLIFGQCAALPLLNIGTMIAAYSKLTKTGLTSWDRKYDWHVSHSKIGFGRWTLIGAGWLALLFSWYAVLFTTFSR